MQTRAYATDKCGRQAEHDTIIELLRADDGTRWTREQLEGRLKHFEPKTLSNTLALLGDRGVVHTDGDVIEAPDSVNQREKLDALSGVVVHVLVSAHPRTLTLAEVAEQCERDLARPDERQEVELALRWIEGDELTVRQGGGWIATRPAVRAAELSF